MKQINAVIRQHFLEGEKQMKQIVEGNISVKACILANKREVFELLVDERKHDKDTKFIIAKAHERGITVTKTTRAAIDKIASGSTHGGVVAYVADIQYASLADHLQDEFIALVEGIEDPFNFGYIIRSLYAAGCTCVLVQERNWMSSADVVTRSSAGASEYMDMVVFNEETIQACKDAGFKFVCGNRKDAISLYDMDFKADKILLGVGGEMRGLAKSTAALADVNVAIPYANDFRNSLNGSSATSVIAFEIFRQKQN